MNRYLARPRRCPCCRPSGSAALPSAVLTASYTDVPYHIIYIFPMYMFPMYMFPMYAALTALAALTAHRRAAPSRCILYQIYLPCMVFPILLRLSR